MTLHTQPLEAFFEALIASGFERWQLQDDSDDNHHQTYTPQSPQAHVVYPVPKDEAGEARYQQIITLLTAAKTHGVPLHPVSRGMNLGYGGKAPFSDAVVVELSHFDRIDHYSPDLHQITVEPGVTQQAISDYLKANGDLHWHDTTGAPKAASVVGNYLDRGFGHTPFAEHAKRILHGEVIVPLGREQTPCQYVTSTNGTFNPINGQHRSFAIGPDLTGLLLQSNIGIVTSLTIELLPKPECFVAYFIPFSRAQVSAVIEVSSKLRAQGTIHSGAHIGNNIKTLQLMAVESPQIITDYQSETLSAQMAQYGLSDWTLSGALYGTHRQVAAHIADLKAALQPLAIKPIFLGRTKLTWVKRMAANYHRYQHTLVKLLGSSITPLRHLAAKLMMLPGLDALCDIKQGRPTDYFLKSIYWRNLEKLTRTPLSPARDNVGLLWGAPCAGITPANFQTLEAIMLKWCQHYQLECPISVTLVNVRNMEAVLSLSFNRDTHNEEDNALACYEAIMLEAADKGFVQYRLSTFSNTFYTSAHLPLPFPLLSIKHALDPLNIIAPGKYQLLSDNLTPEKH